MGNIKRIVDREDVGIVAFDLNHCYTAAEFINKITERLEQTVGNYIIFECDTNDEPTEVSMTIISGREETDDEFNGRLSREKKSNDDFILRKEKDEYIHFLSLKDKFDKK